MDSWPTAKVAKLSNFSRTITPPKTPPSPSPLPPPPVARTGVVLPPTLRTSRAQAFSGRVTCKRLMNLPWVRPLLVMRGSSMEMVLSERKYLFVYVCVFCFFYKWERNKGGRGEEGYICIYIFMICII